LLFLADFCCFFWLIFWLILAAFAYFWLLVVILKIFFIAANLQPANLEPKAAKISQNQLIGAVFDCFPR
jgi:uncharacterized membrane protein YedE/YeeE